MSIKNPIKSPYKKCMVFLIPKLIPIEALVKLLGPGVKIVIKANGINVLKSIKLIFSLPLHNGANK